jgi:pimeloyl-ACP methyl ester carboxylesterase
MRKSVAAATILAAIAFGLAAPGARAAGAACRPSGKPPAATGILLLHGKQGLSVDPTTPGRYGDDWLAPLRQKVEAAGFRAIAPELPWSAGREYDRSFQQALDEIAAAAAALKERGAARLVVVGFSMGANAALGYAALRGGVAAVVVISPAHTPELPDYQAQVAASVAKARKLIAAGQGGQITTFMDTNKWKERDGSLLTTPDSFLSYFDADGDEVMPKNVVRLKPGVPLLWIAGAADAGAMALGQSYAFDKAPRNPLNRYIVVARGHLEAPNDSADQIVAWLKCL